MILVPAMDAWRWLRPTTRAAQSAYRCGRRFRAQSAPWSEDQRRDWVLRRLRVVVREAARRTSYYQERLRDVGFDADEEFGFDDFARLPVLERAVMREHASELRVTDLPEAVLRLDATGGTSGVPTAFLSGPMERGWGTSASDFYMERVGVRRGMRRALFWAHHLDPVQRSSSRERIQDWLENLGWFDCMRLGATDLMRHHQAMARFQPDVVISYAGALAALADLLYERGEIATYPKVCLVTGAEKLFPAQRERIAKVFHRPIHERYGARDVGLIGFQLLPSESLDFTVDWSNLLVEPEADSPDSAVLVTKLHADAQPMIRYRIGDYARFPAGSCPGAPTFRLVEVLGREADRIWRPNGDWMLGLGVVHMMKDLPVREFQLYQFEDFRVELRVVPGEDFSENHREYALRTLRANLGSIPVDIRLVEQLPRTAANKLRPVVSEVEKSPPTGRRSPSHAPS